jgi:hypothetical protein
MIIAGTAMEIFKNERLIPTAKASILVAIDNISKTKTFSGFVSLSMDSTLHDS